MNASSIVVLASRRVSESIETKVSPIVSEGSSPARKGPGAAAAGKGAPLVSFSTRRMGKGEREQKLGAGESDASYGVSSHAMQTGDHTREAEGTGWSVIVR